MFSDNFFLHRFLRFCTRCWRTTHIGSGVVGMNACLELFLTLPCCAIRRYTSRFRCKLDAYAFRSAQSEESVPACIHARHPLNNRVALHEIVSRLQGVVFGDRLVKPTQEEEHGGGCARWSITAILAHEIIHEACFIRVYYIRAPLARPFCIVAHHVICPVLDVPQSSLVELALHIALGFRVQFAKAALGDHNENVEETLARFVGEYASRICRCGRHNACVVVCESLKIIVGC